LKAPRRYRFRHSALWGVWIPCLFGVCGAASDGAAESGPNAGGTLILHTTAQVPPCSTYESTDLCTRCLDELPDNAIDRCEDARATVPPSIDVNAFWVMAAFPPQGSPSLGEVAFGIEYDPLRIEIGFTLACADGVVYTTDWPSSGSGSVVSWEEPRTDHLIVVHGFYAYSDGTPTELSVVPHPDHGGYFADGETPPHVDLVDDYGRLGFGGESGYLPCPEEPPTIPTPLSWGRIKARNR
jgi:hypothetical protein